jgi:hypothetical protein
MADITNAEAVRFCNEKVRVAADRLAQTYYFAKQVQQEWFAANMANLLPNDTSPVIDGSSTDGRHPITGEDVTGIISRCMALTSDFEANDNAKLNAILAVAVNPTK